MKFTSWKLLGIDKVIGVSPNVRHFQWFTEYEPIMGNKGKKTYDTFQNRFFIENISLKKKQSKLDDDSGF